jgi:large subunit ribosomal protein L31
VSSGRPDLPAAADGGRLIDSHDRFQKGVATMKKDIHPEYYETKVSCGCGNKFTTRSTRKELKVDICNVCHPFFTGKLKFVDTAGRIEKFKNKFAAAGYASLGRGKKKEPAAAKS